MSSSNILADRDVNAVVEQQPENVKANIKSMEYHRQVLESKMAEQYVLLFSHFVCFYVRL